MPFPMVMWATKKQERRPTTGIPREPRYKSHVIKSHQKSSKVMMFSLESSWIPSIEGSRAPEDFTFKTRRSQDGFDGSWPQQLQCFLSSLSRKGKWIIIVKIMGIMAFVSDFSRIFFFCLLDPAWPLSAAPTWHCFAATAKSSALMQSVIRWDPASSNGFPIQSIENCQDMTCAGWKKKHLERGTI